MKAKTKTKKIIFALLCVSLLAGILIAQTKYVAVKGTYERMKEFNAALGVECEFCHVKDRSVSIKELDKYDIKKDFSAMRHKRIARAMIGMQKQFNELHGTKTTCIDCHQGEKNPPSGK